MFDYWLTVGAAALGGGIVSALIMAAVTMSSTSRNIFQKSVIEQRQVWRDSLRVLVPRLLSDRDRTSQRCIRDSIVLHLNPSKDREAVSLIDAFIAKRSPQNREAVVRHFQMMLKHEWEKSKIEATAGTRGADRKAAQIVDAQLRQFGARSEGAAAPRSRRS
ncbi:hypothetical protein [Microbacterium maritypicum]|nr:hypothetical protein [Microbacterium liquefaciens]